MATWSYPASWTDICNQALASLGTDLIDNVSTDTTQNAVQCRLFLGEAIDEAFGSWEWKAASERAELAVLTKEPEFGFDHAYQMPSDWIRTISVDVGGATFRIEGDRLLTDADEVFLVYVARPADPTKIPRYLRSLVQATLAKIMAPIITGSEQKEAKAVALAEQAMRLALAADGASETHETVADQLGFTYSDELR